MPDCTDCERLRKSIKEKDLKLSQLEKQIKEYEIEIKELNDQNVKEKEETKKKLEELDKEIEKLKEEKIQLEKEIGKLREKLARMENKVEANEKRHREEIEGLKNTIKENENLHQTKMKDLKDGYKDDMRKLEESNAASIQKLRQEMKECLKAFEWNDEENQKLKEETKELRMNSKGNEKVIQDQHKLYLGQICFELQDNFYRYVMPVRCCAKGYWYKIKELERDIEDESLINDEERKEAQRRFEQLKKRIDWEELHDKFMDTIKQLKEERLEIAHPRVNEKEVRDAAKALNEQGQLRGRTAIERVEQVIEIWLTSKSLPGGQ